MNYPNIKIRSLFLSFFVFVLLLQSSYKIHAAPYENLQDGRTASAAYYIYEVGAIYDIYCKPGNITAINLSSSEEILYVGGGDTARWVLDTARAGKERQLFWQVLVKPLRSDISTNLLINTNKRSYQLNLISTTSSFNTFVEWAYSDEQKLTFKDNTEKFQTEESLSTTKPTNLNFSYKIGNGNYNWKPLQVFDDGQKTFLLMPDKMKAYEAPVLYVKRDKKLAIVNYRVKGKYYIVDRLFDEAELRLGKQIIKISKKGRTES